MVYILWIILTVQGVTVYHPVETYPSHKECKEALAYIQEKMTKAYPGEHDYELKCIPYEKPA